MATKIATRGAQYPLVAVFDLTITDDMLNTAGVLTAFSAAAGIFDVINFPQNSVVIGGDLTVVTASDDSSTATLKIGDATDDDRYLTATNIKSAARTALTLTGYINASGENLRITFANAGADATAGRLRITVQYMVEDRVNEVQTH